MRNVSVAPVALEDREMHRRGFLKVGAATAGGVLLGGCAPNGTKTHQEGPSLILPNEQSSEEIEARFVTDGVQPTLDRFRKQGYELLTEGDPTELIHQCIDERYLEGNAVHCIAGLGVHLPSQRKAIAVSIFNTAKQKLDLLRKKGRDEPVEVILEWHGTGEEEAACGAALVALKQEEKDKDRRFTPQEIDAKAQDGALLLQAELQLLVAAAGLSGAIIITVRQVKPEKFHRSKKHPGKTVFINGHPTKAVNRGHGTGLFFFPTDENEVHSIALDDAVLAAKIMVSDHGAFGHAHGKEHHKHNAHAHLEKPLFVPIGSGFTVKSIANGLRTRIKILDPELRDQIGENIEPYVVN